MTDVVDLTNDDGSASDQDASSDTTVSSSVSVSPTDPAVRQAAQHQLNIAIDDTPEHRLRYVIKKLAGSNPGFEEAILKELVAARKRSATTAEVVTRWEICKNCDEEYDAGGRRILEECTYHSGDMEVDYDNGFADWDERCHGPCDTPDNRRDYPENFVWSCCEEVGSADCCEKGTHVPGGHRAKRARY